MELHLSLHDAMLYHIAHVMFLLIFTDTPLHYDIVNVNTMRKSTLVEFLSVLHDWHKEVPNKLLLNKHTSKPTEIGKNSTVTNHKCQ